MTTYIKYRVRCLQDNIDEEWILPENDSVPTTCPINTAHDIDQSQTTVIDRIEETTVTIKEESTPTGGHFAVKSISLDIPKNSTAYTNVFWPIPVSALTMVFVSEEINRGDCINIAVTKDTITGAIMAPISLPGSWAPQNYVSTQSVMFTHPLLGDQVYTCITDTINNENPTDLRHWKRGYCLTVTPTVIENTAIGYYIKLFDGVHLNDVGRVLHINKEFHKIMVEIAPTYVFSPLSPTYIMQTIYMVKDYELGQPWEHEIGDSKIGGTYIPADRVITVSYTNKSLDADKKFIGRCEYLY